MVVAGDIVLLELAAYTRAGQQREFALFGAVDGAETAAGTENSDVVSGTDPRVAVQRPLRRRRDRAEQRRLVPQYRQVADAAPAVSQ